MCTHTLIITEFVQRSFVNRELQALPSMSMMALYFIRSSKGIRFAAIVWFDSFCHSQPLTNEGKPASIISGQLMLFFTSLSWQVVEKQVCPCCRSPPNSRVDLRLPGVLQFVILKRAIPCAFREPRVTRVFKNAPCLISNHPDSFTPSRTVLR